MRVCIRLEIQFIMNVYSLYVENMIGCHEIMQLGGTLSRNGAPVEN